jgi:hypothetical protein
MRRRLTGSALARFINPWLRLINLAEKLIAVNLSKRGGITLVTLYPCVIE